MRKIFATSAMLLLAVAQQAHCTIVFNELFVNPPGTDNGQEFVEFTSTTGGIESLAGLTLLILEGDGATTTGILDQAYSLSGSTGSNGLWLRRDAAGVIDSSSAAGVQGPAISTTVSVTDFNPDIENGSNTYLLVSGYNSAGITLGTTDLDGDNNGVLDSTPWTSVLDSISFIDNGGAGANNVYANQFGGVVIGPNVGFNADLIVRLTSGGWLATDVLGTNPGGFYAADTTPGRFAFVGVPGAPTLAGLSPSSAVGATPGAMNPGFAAIPEPSAFLFGGVAACGVAGVFGRRLRNRVR